MFSVTVRSMDVLVRLSSIGGKSLQQLGLASRSALSGASPGLLSTVHFEQGTNGDITVRFAAVGVCDC